jgi:Domain of unknown function (DUF5710)
MEQIHPDIPVTKAWRTSRTVFVTAGYNSVLSGEMYGIGAKWDRDEHAFRTGPARLPQVIEFILAETARAQETAQVKSAGLWVKIPFDAKIVRAQAKDLGARWDEDRKEWAMPDEASLERVRELVSAHTQAEKDRRSAAKAKKAAGAKITNEEIIAASGRTVISGERTGMERHDSGGYMKRAEAERYMPEPGEVVRDRGGKYWLTLKPGRVEFWREDTCADLAPHLQPGWHYSWIAVEVEQSADELAAETAAAAGRAS